jgi:hypothetical protein
MKSERGLTYVEIELAGHMYVLSPTFPLCGDLMPMANYVDRHRLPEYSPVVSGVSEADLKVTIFLRTGRFPNNGVSVGIQGGAVKFSELMFFSLHPGDDLCFGCKDCIIHLFRTRMGGSLNANAFLICQACRNHDAIPKFQSP